MKLGDFAAARKSTDIRHAQTAVARVWNNP
jgi:hypothetical protein